MLKKYDKWHKALTPSNQLAVSLIANWSYWFSLWLVAEKFFLNENRSWLYHIFSATWMASLMTIPFNWKRFEAVFKSEGKQNVTSNDDKYKS